MFIGFVLGWVGLGWVGLGWLDERIMINIITKYI